MMIFEAAKDGLTGLRVKMPNSLDVKGTPAAADLEKWCKAEGLQLTWEKRTAAQSMVVRLTCGSRKFPGLQRQPTNKAGSCNRVTVKS